MDGADDTELLYGALDACGLGTFEELDTILDPNVPDGKRFDYHMMKKKYGWAQGWEMPDGKWILPHQWIGKCTLYSLVYLLHYTNRFNLLLTLPDAYIMHCIMNTPIRSWFCMNEVGTGKTFAMVLAAKMNAKFLEQRSKNGETIIARPTLYTCPPQLVTQTFHEVFHAFPEMQVYCFYSNVNQIPQDDPRRDRTFSTQQLDDMMCEWAAQSGNTETAKVVVVTAYTTIAHRWARHFKIKVNVNEWVGDHVHDQCVLRKQPRAIQQDDNGEDGAGPEEGEDEEGETDETILQYEEDMEEASDVEEDGSEKTQKKGTSKLDKVFDGDYNKYATKYGYGSFRSRHPK